MLRSALFAGAAAALLPNAAFAQAAASDTTAPSDEGADAQNPPVVAPPSPADYHAPEEQNVVVTGFRRNRADILSGTSVLAGDELTRDVRATIGESLARQPGVSATSFGPNASRPVLRGFQGERIRVMTDGIGSLDVSNTSVDHAVAINPLTADRIEVLRGPAALLFGSSAIGGVVNVDRLPHPAPRAGRGGPCRRHRDLRLGGGRALRQRADRRAARRPVRLPSRRQLQQDGRPQDRRLRALAGAPRPGRGQPGSRRSGRWPSLRGRLPNSAADGPGTSPPALAWIDGDNNVGFSVNRYDSLYGIPIRFSLDPAVEAEEARIDLRQTRVDGRAEIDTGGGFIDSVRLRGGYSDYRHSEIEDTGDDRHDLLQPRAMRAGSRRSKRHRNGWGGGFGAQYFHRRLEHRSATRNSCRPTGPASSACSRCRPTRAACSSAEARPALRASVGRTPTPTRSSAIRRLRRSFDAFSGSIGASLRPARRSASASTLSHTERAPSRRGIVRQRPPRRHPGLRDRRSRSRQGEEQGRRG